MEAYPMITLRPVNKQFLLSKHSALMDIELELYRLPLDKLICYEVVNQLENKAPVIKVVQELYSQSRDDRAFMVSCIGESLMTKIEKVCKR